MTARGAESRQGSSRKSDCGFPVKEPATTAARMLEARGWALGSGRGFDGLVPVTGRPPNVGAADPARAPAAAEVDLFWRDPGAILATINLKAATHVKFTVWAGCRLLLLPTEMKILELRIANRPAAFIE